MNSQTSTEQTKAWPNKKTAENAENISAMKQNQNAYHDVPAISSQVVCPHIARVTSSEELGAMSKNNLRPIWGIHSLTLIISS